MTGFIFNPATPQSIVDHRLWRGKLYGTNFNPWSWWDIDSSEYSITTNLLQNLLHAKDQGALKRKNTHVMMSSCIGNPTTLLSNCAVDMPDCSHTSECETPSPECDRQEPHATDGFDIDIELPFGDQPVTTSCTNNRQKAWAPTSLGDPWRTWVETVTSTKKNPNEAVKA